MVHPNSLANLKNGESTRFHSGDSAAIFGRKGAESTNRKKAERKTASECAEYIANLKVDEKLQDKLKRAGFKKGDMTYFMAMIYAQYGKAIAKGDTNAAKLILELLGEAPDDSQNVNMTVTNEPKVILEDYDDGRGGYE